MRVAVVGASNDRLKFGNKALRSYQAQGHEVIPVNPRESEVEGLKSYSTVEDVPGEIDTVLMYVPPRVGIELLEGFAAKKVGTVFLNPGTESAELLTRAQELDLKVLQACAILAIGDSPHRY